MERNDEIAMLRNCLTEAQFEGYCKAMTLKYLISAGITGDEDEMYSEASFWLTELMTAREVSNDV